MGDPRYAIQQRRGRRGAPPATHLASCASAPFAWRGRSVAGGGGAGKSSRKTACEGSAVGGGSEAAGGGGEAAAPSRSAESSRPLRRWTCRTIQARARGRCGLRRGEPLRRIRNRLQTWCTSTHALSHTSSLGSRTVLRTFHQTTKLRAGGNEAARRVTRRGGATFPPASTIPKVRHGGSRLTVGTQGGPIVKRPHARA